VNSLIALYARMFLIGIAVAAPVGAMGVLCIQRTLAHGWRAGIATGAGIATADGTYAALAAFGVAAVSQWLVALQTPARIVGGVFLIWLGWRAIVTPPAHKAAKAEDSTHPAKLYATAVGLTLTNPMTIMAFAAIFASAGLAAQTGVTTAAVATLGVLSGSLSWWIVLVTGTALARHAAGDTVLTWVNRASGVLVAGFGVVAIVAGVLAAVR
jgi:putative LysE/RhtB family amino acid efflux pump